VACGEALFPPFVAADPYGAGFAAVLTNVNDVAAMGGVPLGIVDTVVASEELARKALAGMREAAELYDVPIVGGHLTLHEGDPAISAFAVGATAAPLSVTRAAPGQSLVVAAALDGRMREDFPFFPAFESRGRRSAGDVRLLGRLAEDGVVVAAKDISMAGLVGSLAMLLEPGRLGVTVDLDVLPTPAGVPTAEWLACFPAFAFLLTCPAGRVGECLAGFRDRGLTAAVLGELDDTGRIRLTRSGRSATVFDLTREGVTNLRR
jgi:selenophosphate synthetase-related protein